jgi:hypothetical protein
MGAEEQKLLSKLEEWLELFLLDVGDYYASSDRAALRKRCIPGYHSDLLPSLVVALGRSFESLIGLDGAVLSPSIDSQSVAAANTGVAGAMSPAALPLGSPRESEPAQTAQLSAKRLSFDEKFGMGLHRLCWVLTPEAVTSHMAAVQNGTSICYSKFNPGMHTLYPDIGEQYFQKQAHGDLRRYVAALEQKAPYGTSESETASRAADADKLDIVGLDDVAMDVDGEVANTKDATMGNGAKLNLKEEAEGNTNGNGKPTLNAELTA